MKKAFILFFLSTLAISLALFAAEEKPYVLVSVAPHKFFVDKISQGTVECGLMVPAGASAHTYEPTPKQVMSASRALVWFCIGESFEARTLKALQAHNRDLEKVDLRQGVQMIAADPLLGTCCCHANAQDLHIWLSARQGKVQAATIAETLSRRFPQHRELYQKQLALFVEELGKLDEELTKEMAPLSQRLIMVSHPAYAYFCRDYGLRQLPIECEGKDPTPKQLHAILTQARSAGIKTIFVQPQYSSKGARLFAKELKANIVTLDPYSENYFAAMQQIGRAFASQ